MKYSQLKKKLNNRYMKENRFSLYRYSFIKFLNKNLKKIIQNYNVILQFDRLYSIIKNRYKKYKQR